MKRLYALIRPYLDNVSIKKKFYIFYATCILLPLVLTDSIVAYNIVHTEQISNEHEMENISNAVQYSIKSCIESADELGKIIYTSKVINDFMDKEYESYQEYVKHYQEFQKNSLIDGNAGSSNMSVIMYCDNDSIIDGGNFEKLEPYKESPWYLAIKKSGRDKVMYYEYDQSIRPITEQKRKIYFIQKLNFYGSQGPEKVLRIQFDYNKIRRDLVKMNYNYNVYICYEDEIIVSNCKDSGSNKPFDMFEQHDDIGYEQDMEVYGKTINIYALEPKGTFIKGVRDNLPAIFVMLCINILFPILFVQVFELSFTERIKELSKIMNNVDDECLIEISGDKGKDEIGMLMSNYNRMAKRINMLIQIVYKNKIQEQEMMVARKNAELLALHSQINPHFLFNALESIRMHSIIKQEMETADMVEKLALMQRQYVEWGDDLVEVSREMEFVKAYLGLQKYRFGDRLSYELDIEEGCDKLNIPKLSIVTYVENACIHGIESKITPGWIFVRIYKDEKNMYLEVEDTGDGMDESTREALLNRMRKADISMLKEKQRVGIINACLRLKMVSNDTVSFDLDSEKGMGTLVQISIPLEYV